jgi:GNAT superfamily N-acetyltransferase
VTIREASSADLDALFAVQKAASVAAYAHVYPPDRYAYPDDAIRKEIARRLGDEETTYFVAEDDGRIVGFAGVSPGWLEQLYVLPELQGHGVGSALLEAAVAARRAAGDAELRLWTLEDNEAARRFYEARGWRRAEETRVVQYPPHPIDVSYVLAL